MKDQALLELINRRPMLRTTQLADQLDLSIDEVDALLRAQLIAGNIIEHEVTAPNNRPAMAYEVSAHFIATDVFRKMAAEGMAVVAPVAAPASAPTASPTAATGGAHVENQSGREPSKVDRAIACLTQHGTVATGQLRVAMGLRRGQHPSSYLASAVNSGRIIRDGEYWTIGQQEAEQSESRSDGLATGALLGLNAQKPVYRCALWSDDVLEVRKDGVTVAELPKEAGESLAAFLGRLATEGALA